MSLTQRELFIKITASTPTLSLSTFSSFTLPSPHEWQWESSRSRRPWEEEAAAGKRQRGRWRKNSFPGSDGSTGLNRWCRDPQDHSYSSQRVVALSTRESTASSLWWKARPSYSQKHPLLSSRGWCCNARMTVQQEIPVKQYLLILDKETNQLGLYDYQLNVFLYCNSNLFYFIDILFYSYLKGGWISQKKQKQKPKKHLYTKLAHNCILESRKTLFPKFVLPW